MNHTISAGCLVQPKNRVYIKPKTLAWCTAILSFTTLLAAAQTSTGIADRILVKETALSQKVTMHIAKDFFIAGEKLWFSIQVNHPNGKAVIVEKAAFIELLNSDSKPVLQTVVELKDGSASGVLELSTAMPTGKYLFRAYTNALKNGPASLFAEKEITMVNGNKPPIWTTWPRDGAPIVQLFPEGGRWIEGMQNTTAVWCTTSFGEGVQAEGMLLNEAGDTIVQTATDADGKALFTWTPAAGQQYKFLVKAGGRSSTKIPLVVAKEGFAMQLKTLSNNQMELQVQGTAKFTNQPVFVAMPTRNGIKLLQQTLSGGKTTFNWTQQEMAEGTWPIKLYDAGGNLQGLRWCYGQPSSAPEPKLITDKTTYGLRQKVTVHLTGALPDTTFSASVFLVDSLQSDPSMFTNDAINTGNNSEDLDLVLRTMDGDLPTENNNAVFYLPQYEGALVTAQVSDKQTGAPAAGIRAYLSLPGKDFQLASATSTADGLVHLPIKPVRHHREALLQLSPDDGARYNITPANPFAGQHTRRKLSRLRLSEAWAAQLEQRIFAAQVQKAFEDSIIAQQIKKDTLPFYGRPDKSYLLDDYTRFATLDEVMREYVGEVMVRRRDGAIRYQVFNQPYKQLFDAAPLLLVDGVPFFDAGKVMAIDPLKLRKIEVVSRRWAQGSQSYDGIVSLTTYDGGLADIAPEPGAVTFTLPGVAATDAFPMPDYNTPQPHLPDQRTHLFWLPELHTDNLGKSGFSFFTSDVPGRYAVVARGRTPTGSGFTSVHYLKVEK